MIKVVYNNFLFIFTALCHNIPTILYIHNVTYIHHTLHRSTSTLPSCHRCLCRTRIGTTAPSSGPSSLMSGKLIWVYILLAYMCMIYSSILPLVYCSTICLYCCNACTYQTHVYTLLYSYYIHIPHLTSPASYPILYTLYRYLKAHVRDWVKNVITLVAQSGGVQSWGLKRGLLQTLTQVNNIHSNIQGTC